MTEYPRLVLALAAAGVAIAVAFLPSLRKETNTYAYIRPDHPARVANDRLEEIFGDSDDLAVVVALLEPEPGGVFKPEVLNLISWLTDRIRAIPGVDPDQVTSLATEKDIIGTEDGLIVQRFWEAPPTSAAEAATIRDAVLDFELYVDGLVTRDGRATLIVAELLDEDYGKPVYDAILDLAAQAPRGDTEIHVAGLGAYTALIGDYIDADVQRLNPFVGLVLVVMLAFAYRSLRGVLLPLLAAAGGVAVALGAMSAFGLPVYGVTASMSVILIAIGVCDGIHIMGQYYEEVTRRPDASSRELAVDTIAELWRPLSLTSLTTCAGFLALSAATEMPPMRWYGVFASLGVATALVLSLFALPALLAVLQPRASSAFHDGPHGSGVDAFGRVTRALGRVVHRHPVVVLCIGGVLSALCVVGTLRVERDNEYHRYLDPSEPLYAAEVAINSTLGGIQALNVVVEASEAEDLYRPDYLRRIDALQRYLETLPHVQSTRALPDIVKQIHRAMNGDDDAFYVIPDDPDLIAQYFLLYSMSAGPTELEEMVDSEFRLANVRAAFNRSRWSDARLAVPLTESYLRRHFDTPELEAGIAGLIPYGYHVDRMTARSQIVGVPLAFLAVWLVVALSYRSIVAGVLALLPVAFAMLVAYATMGFAGIWLNFATSMTGAIAVGVSVDFAVHTLDRLLELRGVRNLPMREAFESFYQSTGRALLFNWIAVMCGFGVLVASVVPSVREFGVLVAVCVSSSYLASVTLLPALILVLRPRIVEEARTAAVASRAEVLTRGGNEPGDSYPETGGR